MEMKQASCHQWLLIGIMLINGIINADGQMCWNFDYSPSSDWQNEDTLDWTWSGSSKPNYEYIPTFQGSTSNNYIWLESLSYTQYQGVYRSDSFYLYSNDVINVKLWRHLVYNDGDERPLLTFHDNYGYSQHLNFDSYIEDESWNNLTVRCGQGSGEQICCPNGYTTDTTPYYYETTPSHAPTAATTEYPPTYCYGYFEITAKIEAIQEFFAIEMIQINGGCTGSNTESTRDEWSTEPTTEVWEPTTPEWTTEERTTPERPTTFRYSTSKHPTHAESTISGGPIDSNWCCQFETVDLCSWNLHESSIGWRWSSMSLPGFQVPSHSGFYIWEQDETSEVYSSQLTDLPDDTYFQIDYFFNVQSIDPESYLEFSFESDVGSEIIWNTMSSNESYWHTTTLTSSTGGVCNGYSRCNGFFYVRSHNRVGNRQVAAIDNFNVNSACD